jgi:hypothetical protein
MTLMIVEDNLEFQKMLKQLADISDVLKHIAAKNNRITV